MNITESTITRTQSNASTRAANSGLEKPSGPTFEDLKTSASPEKLDKMTSDDLVALVNIIVLLIGGLRSPSAGAGNVGGSPFNSSSGSNFILDFPTLPTMNNTGDSSSGSSLKFPPLPSFNMGNSGSDGAGGDSTGSAVNVNGNILKTRPLPSLVNTSTGSLSTAGSPRAFNPPPIPSLMGNSTQLPSVSASDSSLSTGLSTSPQSNGSAGSSATSSGVSSTTDTELNTRPLPSLVSPATGSLSTPDLPKAFDPPSIPSLTGNSTELPLVSASDNKPITTGLTANSQDTGAQGSGSSSLATPADTTVFHVPAIPSLLGGSTVNEMVASLESGISNNSSAGSSSPGSSSQDQNGGGSGSHWKGG